MFHACILPDQLGPAVWNSQTKTISCFLFSYLSPGWYKHSQSFKLKTYQAPYSINLIQE